MSAIAFFLTLAMIGGLVWLEGAALAAMWGWIVVPVFGVPTLSTAAAIGLCAIGMLLSPTTNGSDVDLWKRTVSFLVKIALAVTIARIAACFLVPA